MNCAKYFHFQSENLHKSRLTSECNSLTSWQCSHESPCAGVAGWWLYLCNLHIEHQGLSSLCPASALSRPPVPAHVWSHLLISALRHTSHKMSNLIQPQLNTNRRHTWTTESGINWISALCAVTSWLCEWKDFLTFPNVKYFYVDVFWI